MRLLLFEYLHANSLWYRQASRSLRAEGREMLQAVAEDLVASHASVSVAACVEAIADLSLPCPCFSVSAKTAAEFVAETREIAAFEAVFPIAPEIDGTLQTLVRGFRSTGRDVIAIPTPMVEVFADKWKTFQFLLVHGIPTPPTVRLSEVAKLDAEPEDLVVLKPQDGAGCDGIVRTVFRDALITDWGNRSDSTIVQRFIDGLPLSVGLIGHAITGEVMILPAAIQDVQWVGGVPKYCGGEIPALLNEDVTENIGQICRKLSQCIGKMSGYVGIDFLLPRHSCMPLVMEINPRLCTSYIGYRQATDNNLISMVFGGEQTVAWKPEQHRFRTS